MRNLKFGNSVLCEHVVASGGGKHTLVNVFSGDVIVSEFPAHLILGVYIEHIPDTEGPFKMSIELSLGEERIGKLDANLKDHKPGMPASIIINAMNIEIKKPSEFIIKASTEGYRSKIVMSKKIYQAAERK